MEYPAIPRIVVNQSETWKELQKMHPRLVILLVYPAYQVLTLVVKVVESNKGE